MSIWNREGIVDRLTALWNGGTSAGDIAKQFEVEYATTVTRNMVVAKVDRLRNSGVAMRSAQSTSYKPKTRLFGIAAKRAAKKPAAPSIGAESVRDVSGEWGSVESVMAWKAEIPQPLPQEDAPPADLVKFDDLTSRSCRWIYGEVRSPDHGYCGKQTVLGQSWCADHCRRVFLTPETRPRRPKITRIPTFADLEKV